MHSHMSQTPQAFPIHLQPQHNPTLMYQGYHPGCRCLECMNYAGISSVVQQPIRTSLSFPQPVYLSAQPQTTMRILNPHEYQLQNMPTANVITQPSFSFLPPQPALSLPILPSYRPVHHIVNSVPHLQPQKTHLQPIIHPRLNADHHSVIMRQVVKPTVIVHKPQI